MFSVELELRKVPGWECWRMRRLAVPTDAVANSNSGQARPLRRRHRDGIAVREMPEDFIAALRVPVTDPELAALDFILDE
jgi:hypothetical protein